MNKKTALIIGLQAILIVTLFWVLVFYGKDEFAAYQEEHEEEVESLNRVSESQGISTVTVPVAAQINSGIQSAKVKATLYNGQIKSFGNVVSIDSLIDAKSQLVNLQAEAGLAKSASAHNLKQYQRLKALNADDKNVSDKAVQEALALVNADKAKIQAADLQIKNLQTNTQLKWGDALAGLLAGQNLPAHLANLLDHKNVLVQVSLPINSATPQADSTIRLAPINEEINPITATYVSPASQSDVSGLGKTYYYSAPAELLRIGMRVSIETDPASSDASNGVVIPSEAVVWYAGTPWVYLKQGKEKFIRKPISTDTEVDEGWFNQSIKAESEVVVKGGQLLLSEEFKYQIKNENED